MVPLTLPFMAPVRRLPCAHMPAAAARPPRLLTAAPGARLPALFLALPLPPSRPLGLGLLVCYLPVAVAVVLQRLPALTDALSHAAASTGTPPHLPRFNTSLLPAATTLARSLVSLAGTEAWLRGRTPTAITPCMDGLDRARASPAARRRGSMHGRTRLPTPAAALPGGPRLPVRDSACLPRGGQVAPTSAMGGTLPYQVPWAN